MTEQTQDITAVDNLVNNPEPKAGVQKYDWFKNDLAGMNSNMADVYSQGYSPEDHVMHESSKYWNDPKVRVPFEEKFGAEAETKFKEVYDMSTQRFQQYKDVRNDITGTSVHKFVAPGKVERTLESLGYGHIDRSKPAEITNRMRDPWGAEMQYYTAGHAVFSPPKHSIRVGAERNGVLDAGGNLVPLEQYLEDNPGSNLVYATDAQGAPMLKNGLNYLRPLKYGEERGPQEEMYGGKLNTYFGMNGIDTPDGYWWKFTGKNLMNFSADVLDSGTEFVKMLDNLWQKGDVSAWDKAMTEFQNDTNSMLFVPTSEAGKQHWYSTEGLVDGVTQVAGQLAGMMAVGRTVSSLGSVMKLGAANSARAGSAAGRLWMASLASDDFVKEARRMGYTPKEQQLFYSLYMLGMYQIAGLSDLVINPAKAKTIQSQILKSVVGDLKTASQKTGGKITPSGIWQAVKNGQNSLKVALATESGVAGYAAAGVTEAAEEVSEVFFDKGFKEGINHIYNPMTAKFTGDTHRDVRFNVNWEDLPTEIAQSATLGFAGGMLARRIIKHDAMNPTTLLGYGAVEGGYDRLERMWDKMYSKGQIIPGGKNIDVLGKETKDVNQSREFLVYKAVKNEIAGARALWDGMKLRKAFTSTQEALKFVNDSSLIKQTSIGKDIAERLSEMTTLEADINTAKITDAEELKKANQRIVDIKQELEDMKAGKYAGKYLAEGLFNMYTHRLRDQRLAEGVKMVSFDRFNQLEKTLSAHMVKVNEIQQSENIPLEELLMRKPSISKEKHTDAIAKLAEKYEITFNEDGEREGGTDANFKKFEEERQVLDDLLYADLPTASSHFLRIANLDGGTGKKFEELILAEQLRASDESNVYDDVESAEQIREGIFERISQIEAIANVNTTFNMLSQKGNLGELRTEIPTQELKDISTSLLQQLGPATGLVEFAKENRESFYNSSLKAWKGQVQEIGGRLVKIADSVLSNPEFADLKQKLDPVLISIANADESDDVRIKEIFNAEQIIHDHFTASPKEAVNRIWELMGMTDRNTAIYEMNHGGVFMYLKSIINMDPKKFRDSYLTALNAATESKITPFPEQYFSIFITTASLMGGYNPIETHNDTFDSAGLINDANLTETVFLNGDQGSGKTFVSSMALRTAQIMRGGGQVVVVAKQEELRSKNFKYLGNFNVDRNPSVSKPMNIDEIMAFLNSDEMAKVSFVYIDETTMYTRDDLAKIDKRVREINATVTDSTKTVKVLLSGDTHQATSMNKDNTESYSLDSRTLLDRTPRTRFSFRTGNQDVLGFLRHLNNLFNTFNTALRPPTVSFKYDPKKMSGFRATDDIDKVIADVLKKKEIVGKDLVIITTPERKAEIRKKHEKTLSDDQILTPMQAQGRQWKYVIVDLPLDFSGTGEGSVKMMRDLISASGRAINMLVIKNQPEIGVLTGDGESKVIEASFTEEQGIQLRNKHTASLVDAGVTEVNVQTEPVNRVIVKAEKQEEVFIYNAPLAPEMRDKLRALMLSITPKAGHSTFLAHSIFTTRIEYDDNGKARIVNDSAQLQDWKKQLFYPEQFEETEFDVDKTIFELRLESTGVPSGLVNKPNTTGSTGKPTLVIYAKLEKDGKPVGEMQVLSIADINSATLPNAKITMTAEQSAIFLQELRTDLPRAEKDTVNQFKKENDARLRGEKVDKKSTIPLAEFKAANRFFNYATKIHHVTRGVGERAGKLPFLFYSPSLTSSQIDEILFKNQKSQALLSEVADTSFTLLESALSDLASQGVFPIALDGGIQIPVDDFLKQLYEDKKQGKDIKASHKLKDKAAERFRNYILNKFKLKADAVDQKALAELEDMKVTGMSAADKYLRKMVIEHIKPTGDFSQESSEKTESTKQPTKKGATIIKNTKRSRENMRLHYNPMLAELYEHSIGETADAKNARKIIDELSDSKGPFPHGVFKNSTTKKGSTQNMDTTFAQLSDQSEQDSEFSVSNLLVPAMPVFQIKEQFIKDVITDGDMSSYDVSIRVTYKPEQSGAQIQLTPEENKAVRVTVDSTKDPEGYSTVDISAGKTRSVSTIWGMLSTWFGNHADSMWIEEFSAYFRKHIIYDNLFRLHDGKPTIVTQQEIHKVMIELKKQFAERAKITKAGFPTKEDSVKLLRTGVPSDRGRYYDYVIAHEFDFLLRHYFSSGISVVEGQYRYTTTDYVQGPVPDENDVSHLDTGNDLVKMHFFAMPIFTDSKKSNYRMPNKEDYYRIIRMVRDNNITSLEKARTFFKVDNALTPTDFLKQSLYLRFLAPSPAKIGGVEYHSLLSAASSPITQEMMSSHITGMLSFLATGSESQYTRSTFDILNESNVTGRSIDIDPSRFRSDLEDSIRTAHKTMIEGKSLLTVSHRNATDSKPEAMIVKFPVAGRKTATWEVRKKGADVFLNTTDGGAVDVSQLSQFMRALGLGDIHKKFFNRALASVQFRNSLFEIGKFMAQTETGKPIFSGGSLNDWLNTADMIADIRQVEGAYGRMTLDGQYQELVTLGYPYIRSNQKIKELQISPGVLRSNPTVTGELAITGFMVKDGFETKDGRRKRPNSKMTAAEQLYYDFNELYLGSLSKYRITDAKQRAVFNPITFSDKGRDGVIQVEGEIIPRRAGAVDMQRIRTRSIESVNNYYKDIARSLINTWIKVLQEEIILSFDSTSIAHITPVTASDPYQVLEQRMKDLNAVIEKLSPEMKRDLVNSELVSELMYTPDKGPVLDIDGQTRNYKMVGKIKQSLIEWVNPDTAQSKLMQKYNEFLTSFGNRYHFKLGEKLSGTNMTIQEAKESYFWNWVWVSNGFNSLWVGPQEQYKSNQEYYDMVKRASQISTNRQRVITRSESWKPGDSIYEGRKMGRFSKVAVISDFSVPIATISGGIVDQKLFDGASFFNAYGKLQMQYSYGNDAGFKVGANIKPIGNYLNPNTGAARYDKYASFEITPQMATQGHPFIKKINELMMSSVAFPEPVLVTDGNYVSNLLELDTWGKGHGLDEAKIYDYMVSKGLQDYFIREITFDSSVKNGISKLNDFGNDMTYFQNAESISYSERDNSEWGLILNASKESNDNDARIATQFISTFLQSTHTKQEAVDIMQAIQRIGDIFRDNIKVENDGYMENLRKAVAKRDEVGILSQLINTKSGSIPMSNRILMNALHSNLSSWMSDESIRFRIFGGQQVIAPASGVWSVVDEVINGVVTTRLSKEGELGRQLKGFNATRGEESILNTPLWLQLTSAVKAKNTQLANQLRVQLRQELATGGWQVQVPEVVISPTHFHAFGIPEGTNIEDITPELFIQIDSQKLHEKFDASIMAEGDRQAYLTGRDGNAATPEQLAAMRQPYIDTIIRERELRGEYMKRYENFRKTLDIIMGRIPATFFQSLTPLKVVGFAHGADNTSYVHPDILVLQGADHDIDKGNIMSYEPSKNGEIIIPNSLVEAGDDPIALKNFIVKRMMDGLMKPPVLIESTLPTSTVNIDNTIEQMGLSPNKNDSTFNPISNNDSFVRGQSGKQNIAIHASGLKTYSSVFHSAIQRGRTYSNYIPESASLGKGGLPFVLSGIDGGVEGLIMFGEAIQASVDNAKDPKLGLLGWDATNGRIVNALAMFGYSPQQIASFLAHPDVKSVYDEYRMSKEFFMPDKLFYTSLKKILTTRTMTPELRDLSYLLDVGEKMMNLTRVVGINREIPNNIMGVIQMRKAFDQVSDGVTLQDYMMRNKQQREYLADEQQRKIESGESKAFINVFEILNDNYHLFSYLQSMSKLDHIMSKSNMYGKIIQGASGLTFYDETEFKRYEDMMYGLAVDAYIASKADGKYLRMNGKLYDMTAIQGNEHAQSRIEFMKDFPQYFKGLNSRQDSLQSMMIVAISGENPILKFEGNWRDYPVERKVKARMLMESLDKDVSLPSGDTSLSNMMFYYSLIKDKGAMTSSSLTDVFDYNNSEFAAFDRFVDHQFGTPYLSSQEDMLKLYVDYSGKYHKLQDKYRSSFMKLNRDFIPYTNDLTINDKISAAEGSVPPEGFSSPSGTTSMNIKYTVAKPDDDKVKKSKKYIDSEQKKALAYPVNRRILTRLAETLGRKYNVETFVLSSSEMATRFGSSYGAIKGAAIDGQVFINADIATIDTPLHEFTHLWLEILKGENRQMYDQINKLSLSHPYADRIREIYPELDDNGVAGEVFATLMGLHNAGKSYSSVNTTLLQQAEDLFKRFMNWLNNLFLDIFGMKPSVNDSLLSIIDKVGESMLSSGTFGLSPYDKQVLKVLGVRTQTVDDPLSIIRDRLKLQNRFEKICA